MGIFKVAVNAGVTILVLAASMALQLVWADSPVASTAIASAKSSLVECFAQVQAAERAGANITSLLNTLNEANGLLAEAEAAYSRNDTATAYNLAVESQNLLNNFKAQVDSAVDAAVSQKNQSFQIFLVSLVGSLTVVGVGVAGWVYVGKKNKPLEDQTHECRTV